MNISVIVPLVKMEIDDKVYNEMAVTAIKSVPIDTKILVVGTKSKIDGLGLEKNKSISGVELTNEEENMNIQHFVNKGVAKCKTDYFSILQICDTFTEKCFDNAEKYMNSDYASSMMLTLEEVKDFEHPENGSIAYMNEAVWANGFSEQMGIIDRECIEDFFNFSLFGAVINKEDYLSVGGLKESMHACFWHEFLLRWLQYNKTAFVVPKVGYYITLGIPTTEKFSDEELEFWNKTAKTEYFYKQDRNKTFE